MNRLGGYNPAELFERMNTTKLSKEDEKAGKQEVLDSNEIEKAKSMGFSLFELKENMTLQDFENSYDELICSVDINGGTEETDNILEQDRQVQAKYIQLQYGSKTEIGEDETPLAYELRLKAEAGEKNVNDKPTMGLN